MGADPEAEAAEYQEAVAAGLAREVPLGVVAGRVAESLPTGPDLAGWLALAPAGELEDGALAGVAASFRRLASWAVAGELAAVAQIASRSARTDRRAGTDESGRPDRVTTDAAGQVALALTMSQDGANAWADLGVTLTWRLPGTGAALSAGEIDLPRARMIARMTGPLSDAAAREVERSVLERAGLQTLGQLHAALRRAVIKADPEGAERRREEAERNAKVVLYPEDEGTATLAGYSLPGIHAAAAMSRITALAKARKAAGAAGRIDLLRAQVFLGLLLGTLPYIPPASGAPPDVPPDDEPPEPDEPPGGEPPGREPPGGALPDEEPPGEAPTGEPAGHDDDAPGDLLLGTAGPWPDVLPFLPPGPDSTFLAGFQPAAGSSGPLSLMVPFTTLAGTSASPGQLTRIGVITPGQARYLATRAAQDPACKWRVIVTTPAGQAIAVTHVPRPRAGPGHDPPGGGAALTGDTPLASGAGLVGRVALTVSTDLLGHDPHAGACSPLARLLAAALAAAGRAAARAAEQARADQEAGGCAHGTASAAYQPPPRIRELVTARDVTCRFAPCRRPVSRCDLDHTVPFGQGGPTCSCNLGGECRLHHQLKQHPRWTLTQPSPGVFRWTTPAGRNYTVRPDPYSL